MGLADACLLSDSYILCGRANFSTKRGTELGEGSKLRALRNFKNSTFSETYLA